MTQKPNELWVDRYNKPLDQTIQDDHVEDDKTAAIILCMKTSGKKIEIRTLTEKNTKCLKSGCFDYACYIHAIIKNRNIIDNYGAVKITGLYICCFT